MSKLLKPVRKLYHASREVKAAIVIVALLIVVAWTATVAYVHNHEHNFGKSLGVNDTIIGPPYNNTVKMMPNVPLTPPNYAPSYTT